MTLLLAPACVAALAWANGANDNFKGAVTGRARWATIAGSLAAWLVTLPSAAVLGASCMRPALLLN